jgi:chemotaxis protein CheC
MDIQLSVPSSAVNMLGGILTVPIAEYGYETDKLMYFNADFVIGGQKLNDWLLMLPDIESLNRILTKLGV